MHLTAHLKDLYTLHHEGRISYAEYIFRHGKATHQPVSFARFRLEGGTQAEYDFLRAGN